MEHQQVQPSSTNVDTVSNVPDGSGMGRRHTVTWTLIALNVAMFVITTLFGMHSAILFTSLSLRPSAFTAGTSWTLVSSMFLHADFWHLLMNMYSLYLLGCLCEDMLGRRDYLIAYFGGGIAGGLLFVFLRRFEATGAVGASGAIFSLLGVYGAFLMAARRKARDGDAMASDVSLESAWQNFVLVLVINLGMPFLVGNIAWEGHISGLAFGLAFGALVIARASHRWRIGS